MGGDEQAECLQAIVLTAKTWGGDAGIQWLEIGRQINKLENSHEVISFMNEITSFANDFMVKTVIET